MSPHYSHKKGGTEDIFVHLGRLRDKSRRVLSITEVVDYEAGEIVLNELFHFYEKTEIEGCIQGELKKIGFKISV